ncbi:MAG: N-acetylmuramoyl-L-alanine amidase [Granulosicoccaceae bacterium]
MQHRFDEGSIQTDRVWRGIFLTALLVSGLQALLGAFIPASTVDVESTIAAIDAQAEHNAPSHITVANRSNPHPPIASYEVADEVADEITVDKLPNLAFGSILNITLKGQPYTVLPIANALNNISWVNSSTDTHTLYGWKNMRASLGSEISNASTNAINQLVALFQPEVKPDPKQWVIAIDAGHGGSDPGSEALNGLIEKELTLDIAQRASAFLSELDNVKVVLTRDEDRGMSRWSRVNKVKRSNADVVVSLHFNHLPQTDINLVETYYAGQQNIMESQAKQLEEQGKPPAVKMKSSKQYNFTKQSARLANIMQSRVYNEVRMDNPQAADAGVKQDTLFILTRSFTPGVLIELSCLSNKIEAARLTDEAYRARIAASLADGIRDYLQNELEQKSVSDIEV